MIKNEKMADKAAVNQQQQHLIPIQSLKSGQFKYKVKKDKDGRKIDPEDCCLFYEETSSKIYFKLIDQKRFLKSGEKHHITLEFTDITAADLKVVSKFGSWDTMTCRLLLENYTPLVSWTVENIDDVEELVNRRDGPTDNSTRTGDSAAHAGDNEAQPSDNSGCADNDDTFRKDNTATLTEENAARAGDSATAHVRRVQESCMVKATFDIKDLQSLRDVLHLTKANKLRERKNAQEQRKSASGKGAKDLPSVPSKIREGLPEWVNYIPAKWYSSTVRQVFEYMIAMYTLLTLLWALWQLYKHVGFIRQILRPLFEIIEFYLEVLRGWFRWLDRVTDLITNYWWMYLKPVFLLAAPLYTALASLFKPLRNVADVIAMVTRPVTSMLRFALAVFRPLVQPLIAAFDAIKQLFTRVYKSFALLWDMAARWSIVRLIIDKLQGMGLQRMVQEISNTNMDPFKAQVVVIQNLLVRSSKQIYSGLRFIGNRIYYVNVFVKRERDYARENEIKHKDKVE